MVVLKPTQGSDFSRSVQLFNRSGKNVLFAHSTSPLPQLLASQDTGHHQTSRASSYISSFCDTERSFPIRKKNIEKSQAIPRCTDHLRPSNLAARTLSFVEHTLSKFGGDPCRLRRGLAAAVKCYVQKARFFRFC